MDDTDYIEEVEEMEILDTENYRAEKEQEFSHQVLVMSAFKKVIEYGCQELIPGYYDTTIDGKGNTKIVYKQDTRKAFIESIRTLRMVMICDFDSRVDNKLIPSDLSKLDKDNWMDQIEITKNKYLTEQKKWWDGLSQGQQRGYEEQGMDVMDGYFNTDLPFYHQYFLDELEIYRRIFEELTKLTSRLKFYGRKHYESGPRSGSGSKH